MDSFFGKVPSQNGEETWCKNKEERKRVSENSMWDLKLRMVSGISVLGDFFSFIFCLEGGKILRCVFLIGSIKEVSLEIKRLRHTKNN